MSLCLLSNLDSKLGVLVPDENVIVPTMVPAPAVDDCRSSLLEFWKVTIEHCFRDTDIVELMSWQDRDVRIPHKYGRMHPLIFL